MNDKWVNIAIMITLFVFASNAFLTFGSALPNTNGEPINFISAGSQPSGLSHDSVISDFETRKGDYNTSTNAEGMSRSAPGSTQGFNPFNLTSVFQSVGYLWTMVAGFQMFMGVIANMYPDFILLIGAFTLIVTAIQAYGLAHIVGSLARAIFGRPI